MNRKGKKTNRYFLLLAYVLCLAVPKSFAQTIEQAFGLRFTWRSFSFTSTPTFLFRNDSTRITDNGLYPLRIEINNPAVRFIGSPEESSLYWSRTVVLPVNAGEKECRVTLNCKSEVDSLRFVAIALDREENELYTDSVIIHPATQWGDYSLTFRKKEVRAVKIIIRHNSNFEANKGRSIYLNKVNICLGDQKLNDFPISSLVQGNETRLNPQAIIPLSFENDDSLANIHDWKDKKIIALGEMISGIKDLREAQIQFMKHLIMSENCKLILLELPEDLCMRWNLYLQGKQPDLYEAQLTGELKFCMHNSAVFFEFMKWVRQYNAKADNPVRIIGINTMDDFGFRRLRNAYLTDYLLKLSANRQDSAYYLQAYQRALYMDEYQEVKEHISQSQLPNTLHKQDFQYLLFLMDEIAMFYGKFVEDNDIDRAKRVKRIIDIYLSPAEKAVIIASSKQINKRFPIPDLNLESDLLGSYLHQQYGKQYYAVSFQFGERTCLTDTLGYGLDPTSYNIHVGLKDAKFVPLIDTVNWKPPFPFAFERAAMDSRIPYFYYPSDQLPEAILGLSLFTRISSGRIPFCYCHIPSQFDALVFIREAKATRDWRDYPLKYHDLDDYARNIASRLDKLLEELKE